MDSLITRVETRVRQATYDRIRHLKVEADRDRVIIRGQAPTYYDKQLALHGALGVLPGDRFDTAIRVAGG